ncbi:VOC family protein [Asticcacaulis sp. BYS171W]|uniref:VOC family protein n=1 Tax=Asticcacaulis aquaticus TaxID=2984212 RepID=A0ABT5HVE4_9CAUL|nr:VOC family protein [Asticcacaulis aquaticus]MDC7683406.1 VOC family protein [Asticcacaulis aquaticus]
MSTHHKIDYIEWPAGDLPATKSFYQKAFGWSFIDYGPSYGALSEAGIDGGFDADGGPAKPLVILYSDNLEQSRDEVVAAGGGLTKDIFDFPGGRRFQFTDPSGNELGVWSDK